MIYSSFSALAPRVYRFPVFEKSFCEELVEELEHFEQSSAPKGRPNTMNHYGVIQEVLLAGEDFKLQIITALLVFRRVRYVINTHSLTDSAFCHVQIAPCKSEKISSLRE